MGMRLLFIGLICLAGDFSSAVLATHPVAFYRMDFLRGRSMVGSTEYSSKGGVKVASDGAPIGMADNGSVVLDGSGSLVTTQSGGIGPAASVLAWVNLAALPSAERISFQVAGESNELNVQFDMDNSLKFSIGASGLVYRPASTTLVRQWHMIVTTIDATSRTIYWDGKPVASDQNGGNARYAGVFTIGRDFKGGIDEVALWNRALKASEVAAIYSAASPSH
jgi:hypothetical protein